MLELSKNDQKGKFTLEMDVKIIWSRSVTIAIFGVHNLRRTLITVASLKIMVNHEKLIPKPKVADFEEESEEMEGDEEEEYESAEEEG